MLVLIASWFLVCPSPSHGASYAKAMTVRGDVRIDGSAVKSGQEISGKNLTTGPGASARVLFHKTKNIMHVTPSSQVEMDAAQAGVQLQGGMARFQIAKGSDVQFRVRTKSATMGVRGTDFMTVYNALLNESEIVVFEGAVQLKSELSSDDEKLVNKGQWGGVGGRYRQQIGDLIDLPTNVLQTFDRLTKVK